MKTLVAITGWMALVGMVRSETLAERLLASYEAVQSVSCELRRETRSEGGNVLRILSRVHWRHDDRLHAETVSPLRRRVVADGETLFSYIEGDPMGFARPIERLDPDWLVSLRKIPGTPTEFLLRLQGVPETVLAPAPEFPVRRGYATPRLFVVLAVDTEGRVGRVETYRDAETGEPLSVHRFEQWEAREGAWFSLRQETVTSMDGGRVRETVQILRLEVNPVLPAPLFQPQRFFRGVRFTDDFRRIYPAGGTSR